MDTISTITVTPLQAILVVMFQLWLLLFPLLILWKVEKLSRLIEFAMQDASDHQKEDHVQETE